MQFYCGCIYINYTFCDTYLQSPGHMVDVEGGKQPDCKTIQTSPCCHRSHCCKLTCCVKHDTKLQIAVREWEHLAVLPVGWRITESNSIPDYGLRLDQAQRASLIPAWRHLNLCSAVIKPGRNDSLGILNPVGRNLDATSATDMTTDIPSETQVEHIFREFSYDLKEARNQGQRAIGSSPADYDQYLQQVAASLNGLGRILSTLLHVGTKIVAQSSRPNPGQAPLLSSFQREQIEALELENCLSQDDQAIVNAALSVRHVPQSTSDYEIQWNQNEDTGGPHSLQAFYRQPLP